MVEHVRVLAYILVLSCCFWFLLIVIEPCLRVDTRRTHTHEEINTACCAGWNELCNTSYPHSYPWYLKGLYRGASIYWNTHTQWHPAPVFSCHKAVSYAITTPLPKKFGFCVKCQWKQKTIQALVLENCETKLYSRHEKSIRRFLLSILNKSMTSLHSLVCLHFNLKKTFLHCYFF